MIRHPALLFALFIACPLPAPAQCSDAGVCSIGAHDTSSGYGLRAGYAFGKRGGKEDLTVHAVHLEGSIPITADARLSAAMPWSHTSGPLGNAGGIGDLTLLVSGTVGHPFGGTLGLQAGGKLATGAVNAGGLPQAYQPGLGTHDLLLGISYEADAWLLAAGYQFSRGRSGNTATRLKRGDDLLGRAGYRTTVADLPASVEMLAIRRLHRSSVRDTSGTGDDTFLTVEGSDQFQFNLLGMLTFPLGGGTGLRAGLAVPLRAREVNPDGLTRSLSLSLDLLHSF